VKTDKLNR